MNMFQLAHMVCSSSFCGHVTKPSGFTQRECLEQSDCCFDRKGCAAWNKSRTEIEQLYSTYVAESHMLLLCSHMSYQNILFNVVKNLRWMGTPNSKYKTGRREHAYCSLVGWGWGWNRAISKRNKIFYWKFLSMLLPLLQKAMSKLNLKTVALFIT